MRAVVIDHRRRSLHEKDIAEPRIERPDDVLFRVREVGVCGTDRELAEFLFGYGPQGDDFLVPGHEAVGEVIASSAPGFAPGDVVVPAIRRACQPPCDSCRKGRRDLCLTGGFTERGIFGEHGYFTELAVDRAADLTRIPREAADFAVLIEPLSVVEKAVAMGVRLHQGEPRRALVVGAGSIGLLSAALFRRRGFDTAVVSVEPPDSDRAELVALAGAEYHTSPEVRKVDIVIEAAGSPDAVTVALKALAPMGVLVVLGAQQSPGVLPLIDLIVGNQIIAGSVNASPEAFASAATDLAGLPRELLNSMIEYREFSEYPASFSGAPAGAPKIVHRMV